MIKKIDKNELLDSFFSLVAEVEFGDHFDKNNPEHVALLNNVIGKNEAAGCEIFGYYDENDGRPLGFITTVVYRHLHTSKAECEVLEIGVVKGFRGKGYGSRLLEYIEHHHNNGQIYCILVKTYAGSFDVVHFYGRNGYVPVSVIPDTQGPDDEGTLVMRKPLKYKVQAGKV